MNANIALSKLLPGKVNPRRVKPDREAHRRMVASIRSFGVIAPLVVRHLQNGKQYQVIAGNRRLAALKEVHRHSKREVKVECQIRQTDEATAEALSLAENFIREREHPLDEAETFARLAGEEGKNAQAIADQFGVGEQYVRQRMKLATLAGPIKTAYRQGEIDTGTAETFTSVPEERQMAIWQELNGQVRHADQVRRIIQASWIDAAHALFDVSALPPFVVSRDLFNETVLVERSAFLTAQMEVLTKEKETLLEAGWREVVVGARSEVQDRVWPMAEAEVVLDEPTSRKLKEIEKRWEKLEGKIREIPEEDDGSKAGELQEQLDALEAEAEKIRGEAPKQFSEATKAKGTVFLMLDAEGQVDREYRIPRKSGRQRGDGSAEGVSDASPEQEPTSEELSDRQLATAFTHQALGVRQKLLTDRLARKRVLVLILHEKVRSEALAIRQEANQTTLHADDAEARVNSAIRSALVKLREEIDPFAKEQFVDDVQGYRRLCKLSEAKLDALIELLSVECLTAHLQRRTPLIEHLAKELAVKVREDWRPDAVWLSGYQKVQLAHLIGELCGAVNRPAEDRKKSELILSLEKLFADAAEGKLADTKLAERVNGWLPSNLRQQK